MNIVPQASRLNQGHSAAGKRWRALERLCWASTSGMFMFVSIQYDDKRLGNGWRVALLEGATIGVDIALTEGPDNRIPEFVIVTYREGDVEESIPFINEPLAQ